MSAPTGQNDALKFIVTEDGIVPEIDDDEGQAIARRIQACVAACEGISTEELEAGIIHDLCRVLGQVVPELEEKKRLEAMLNPRINITQPAGEDPTTFDTLSM